MSDKYTQTAAYSTEHHAAHTRVLLIATTC